MGQEENKQEDNKQDENKMAYSYHNFIFPFVWHLGQLDRGKSFDDIREIFKSSGAWDDDDLSEAEWSQMNIDEEDVQADGLNVNKMKYATYQYYKPAIRDAIFGKNNDANTKEIVDNFSFNPIKSGRNAKYIIKKRYIEYSLDISDIKLRLYNTGVGLLVFVCENRKRKNLSYIKGINDYGRRITVPFIPDTKGVSSSVCADYIRIKWDDKKDGIDEYFTNSILAFNKKEGECGKNNPNLNHIADFIKKILNYSLLEDRQTWIFTTNKDNKQNKYWYIEPALDDRMFVMCAVYEDFLDFFNNGVRCSSFDYINALNTGKLCSDKEKSSDYEKFEESLYEFMFCDSPGNCTCLFRQMRQQLIKEHLYCRWIGPYWGTFYSIAAQAFTCVSNADYIINYFRTEYYEMICLVLAQRASIRAMQNEASELSVKVDKDDQRKEIANLQEKLIKFQNQINHYEVSSQEQAIELYDMMREIFLVNKYTGLLQEQLDGLYNVANIRQSVKFSQMGWFIAIVALCFALPSFISDFAGVPDVWHIGEKLPYTDYSGWILTVKCVLLAVIVIVGIIMWNYEKK